MQLEAEHFRVVLNLWEHGVVRGREGLVRDFRCFLLSPNEDRTEVRAPPSEEVAHMFPPELALITPVELGQVSLIFAIERTPGVARQQPGPCSPLVAVEVEVLWATRGVDAMITEMAVVAIVIVVVASAAASAATASRTPGSLL